MKKWLIGAGVIALAGLLVWYFILKSHDYRVSFPAKTFPGTINQTIKSWNATLDSARIVSQESLGVITQQLSFNDSLHEYRWEIKPLTDSTSTIRVYASDSEHRLANRLLIPFLDTDFEKRTRKTLLDFHSVLDEHIDEFRVKVIGEAELKEKFCAYVRVRGHQFDKARGMMYHSPLLGSILVDNQVPLNGQPFLEVTQWNRMNDSITYDFCYPIKKRANLPEHPELHYREFPARKAIKAIYNGNYITSDRAWYALLDYARKKGIAVTEKPVEVFLNNPNMGGDELQWTAEIYLPIKASDE